MMNAAIALSLLALINWYFFTIGFPPIWLIISSLPLIFLIFLQNNLLGPASRTYQNYVNWATIWQSRHIFLLTFGLYGAAGGLFAIYILSQGRHYEIIIPIIGNFLGLGAIQYLAMQYWKSKNKL